MNKKIQIKSQFIGKWFLSFSKFISPGHSDNCIQWQGQVIARIEEGIYLVQLYDWLAGNESNLILLSIKDMMTFDFFENTPDGSSSMEFMRKHYHL
jgi:hypothetical protein